MCSDSTVAAEPFTVVGLQSLGELCQKSIEAGLVHKTILFDSERRNAPTNLLSEALAATGAVVRHPKHELRSRCNCGWYFFSGWLQLDVRKAANRQIEQTLSLRWTSRPCSRQPARRDRRVAFIGLPVLVRCKPAFSTDG